jgi:hypothetical protein
MMKKRALTLGGRKERPEQGPGGVRTTQKPNTCLNSIQGCTCRDQRELEARCGGRRGVRFHRLRSPELLRLLRAVGGTRRVSLGRAR